MILKLQIFINIQLICFIFIYVDSFYFFFQLCNPRAKAQGPNCACTPRWQCGAIIPKTRRFPAAPSPTTSSSCSRSPIRSRPITAHPRLHLPPPPPPLLRLLLRTVRSAPFHHPAPSTAEPIPSSATRSKHLLCFYSPGELTTNLHLKSASSY